MKLRRKYTINSGLSNIKALLLDLQQYGAVHPLIIQVDKTEQSYKYKIIEKPYPIVPIKINYHVLVSQEEDRIRYDLEGIPFFQVHITYLLHEVKAVPVNKTVIDFSVEVIGKIMGKRILARKILKAQYGLWQRYEEQKD